MPVQNYIFIAEAPRTQRKTFLFVGRRSREVYGGDADKQKSFSSIIRRLTIGAIAIKGFDLIPEGTESLIQSSSPDWIRRRISLSDLCDSAVKPGFEGVEFRAKSPIKSTEVAIDSTVL